MGRRTIEEKNVRSITKLEDGKSYAVTFPGDVIRRWKWQNHQKITLTISVKKANLS